MTEERTPGGKRWLGYLVMPAVAVVYLSCSAVSLAWTVFVSAVILAGLVAFFWRVGAIKEIRAMTWALAIGGVIGASWAVLQRVM